MGFMDSKESYEKMSTIYEIAKIEGVYPNTV